MESAWIQRHFSAISSLTLSPVQTATKTILAYGSGVNSIRLANSCGVIVGFGRRALLSSGRRTLAMGLLMRKSGTAERRTLDRASLTFTMDGCGIFRLEKYRCKTRGVKSRRQQSPKAGCKYFAIFP